jgi:hypothetical protein
MKKAHQPFYSPDLAPCDFDLPGDVKGPLSGCSFADADALLRAVLALSNGMENRRSRRFFRVDRAVEKLLKRELREF